MDGRKHKGTGEDPARDEAADRAALFEEQRRYLFGVAYRMLGSVADAEDVLQEAFLRWRGADPEKGVGSPRAYLSAVVTRLCIDQLRLAKRRREEYVGPWLPEPLVSDPHEGTEGTEEAVLLDESLSMAFLVLLESLSPAERAVFILREVFGYGYAEVARIVGKSEAACRQISHRARAAVAARRPRFAPSPQEEERLLGGFLQAATNGDMEALLSLLSEDATFYSDGGGKTRAALNPVHGAGNVARFLFGVLGKAPPDLVVRRVLVNGRPGLVTYFGDGRPQGAVSLEAEDGRIRAIRLVVNPEKLGALPPLPPPHPERGDPR